MGAISRYRSCAALLQLRADRSLCAVRSVCAVLSLHAALPFVVAGLMFAASTDAQAQVYPNSPVFRNYRPPREQRGSGGEGLRRQINIFLLERDAAKGDPLAQHELGVRYLTGRGVKADTALSAEWLRRAAEQGLAPAMYNYALLLNNGWSVPWDPFTAYRFFRRAAEAGMPEARFVVGVYHTDGLVFEQDWEEAYRWISLAAEAGHGPAQHAKAEIIRRGHVRVAADSSLIAEGRAASAGRGKTARNDATAGEATAGGAAGETAGNRKAGSNEARQEAAAAASRDERAQADWTPILLDFDRDTSDTFIPTERLMAEYLASARFTGKDSLSARGLLSETPEDSALIRLRRMAAAGNPEALVLRGRLREEGRTLPADRTAAAADYAAAVFLESMRAPQFLLQLLRRDGFAEKLSRAAWGGDADAQYVWAVLRGLEFDMRLTGPMALDMLRRAAEAGNTAALVQLGIWRSAGRWTERDVEEAEQYWLTAARLHDAEARVRLAAAAVLGRGTMLRVDEAMPLLDSAVQKGSLIAQVALAYTYERGVGRTARKGEAVRLYRDAAIRGSQSAYRALRRMYEALRPEDALFRDTGD